MSARAKYLRHCDKVAIAVGPRRILASWHDAAELLAELQLVFDERCVNDNGDGPDGVSCCEEKAN